MTTLEKQMELKNKLLLGLEKVYEKLIEFKKQKKSELVIMKDGKIVKIKPQSDKKYIESRDKHLDFFIYCLYLLYMPKMDKV